MEALITVIILKGHVSCVFKQPKMNLIHTWRYFMNLNDAARNLIILFLSCISVSSEAVIIQGTFEGMVINAGDDSYEDPTYVNYWNENPIGTQISGRFQYDTTLAPEPKFGWRNTASYGRNNVAQPQWLSVDFFIDGRWVDSSSNHPDGFEPVEINKIVGIVDIEDTTYPSYGDYFSLLDSRITQNDKGIRKSTYAWVGMHEQMTDIINNLGLIQDFSWTRETINSWGMGTYEVIGEKNGQAYRAWASMDISNMTVSPQRTSVPEPSSFYLLVIGLFGLLACKLGRAAQASMPNLHSHLP
jgi:hypothetical protein